MKRIRKKKNMINPDEPVDVVPGINQTSLEVILL